MRHDTYTRPELREVPRQLVAAKLAAATMRRADTLTAAQVDLIAATLGIDNGGISSQAGVQTFQGIRHCNGTLNATSYMLFCDEPADHDGPHEWVEHPCPEQSCTRSAGHPGGHR